MVFANDISLAAFAHACGFLHDVVDALNRHLEHQHTQRIAALVRNSLRDKARWRTVAWRIGPEVKETILAGGP